MLFDACDMYLCGGSRVIQLFSHFLHLQLLPDDVQGLVEDWMLMEAHDSTEATGVDGLANPYAYTAPAPF
jgi:hypothetical protein